MNEPERSNKQAREFLIEAEKAKAHVKASYLGEPEHTASIRKASSAS